MSLAGSGHFVGRLRCDTLPLCLSWPGRWPLAALRGCGLDRALRNSLCAGDGWYRSAHGSAHRVHATCGGAARLARRASCLQLLCSAAPAASRPDGDFPRLRPGALLSLLGSGTDSDVLPDQCLGWHQSSSGSAQVFPLHSGRQPLHAGRHDRALPDPWCTERCLHLCHQ